MTFTTICVCGSGTMGSGIAQAAAQSGYTVILYDRDEAAVSSARIRIKSDLENLVSKGKMPAAESKSVLDRITFSSFLADCKAGLFIEAIVERMDAKASLFNSLMEINGNEPVFATNTSSLPVTVLAGQVKFPSRVAGLHFFNPATIMKLVEIIRTPVTEEQVITLLQQVITKMGKKAVLCEDSAGFIVNRVARPFYIETLRLVEEGHTSYGQADRLMESSGFRLGPFRLMDMIGNDVNYAVSCSVHEQLGDPGRLKPSYLQKDLVDKGRFGKKSGKGYYEYE